MNDASILANYYNKTNGVFLFSGTLAIEYALSIMDGIKGSNIIVPSNVCFNVLLSVIRAGMTPVLVNPGNQMILTSEDIMRVRNQTDIKAVIAVHNLGIPVNTERIRKQNGDIIILEDCSQYFPVGYTNIGRFSDFVVTSFGNTKPLSFGIGGGLFSNEDVQYAINSNSVSDRDNVMVYPYRLPDEININANELVNKAKERVTIQKRSAGIYQANLSRLPLALWKVDSEDIEVCWHRFPVWCFDNSYYDIFIQLASRYNISYQLPHKEGLESTLIMRNHQYQYFDLRNHSYPMMLLRTFCDMEEEVLKWTKHLSDL